MKFKKNKYTIFIYILCSKHRIHKLLVVLSLSIFIIEVIIKLFLHDFFLFFNSITESFIDSALLIICLTPIFYFVFNSPMRKSINTLVESEKHLKIMNEYETLNEKFRKIEQ